MFGQLDESVLGNPMETHSMHGQKGRTDAHSVRATDSIHSCEVNSRQTMHNAL